MAKNPTSPLPGSHPPQATLWLSLVISLLLAVVQLLTLPGCTNFKGPGDFKTPDQYNNNQATGNKTQDENGEEVDQVGENDRIWSGSSSSSGDSGSASKKSQDMKFRWPLDDAQINQKFDINRRRPHWGVDLAGTRGTPIKSSEEGLVIYTGHDFRGYGNLIVIEHPGGWATLYSHLDKFKTREGVHVNKGQLIGTVGSTGRATGPHLHFELRYRRRPVNPEAYLPEIQKESD